MGGVGGVNVRRYSHLYSQHVHSDHLEDPATRRARKTCDGPVRSARACPEPTPGSLRVVLAVCENFEENEKQQKLTCKNKSPHAPGSFISRFLVRLRVGSAQGYREAVKARPSGPPEPAPGAPPTPGAKAARRGQQGTPASGPQGLYRPTIVRDQ